VRKDAQLKKVVYLTYLHKKYCKERAAELRDVVVFKDPPPKEECPICFLPMPNKLISCMSLPPATRLSVSIYDYAEANEGLKREPTEEYYPCCGKSICRGCIHSCRESGNIGKCPFCNTDRDNKTDEEEVEEIRRRVEANDAASIYLLANSYDNGTNGFPQDHARAIELYAQAADLGHSQAHHFLGSIYYKGGTMKKAKLHLEAAAMAGHEIARYNLGVMEAKSGNIERAIKHWTIAASVGEFIALRELRMLFEKGLVSRESIDSTLVAYNTSCAELRSEARDAYIRTIIES
jgi:TPR repeat protein